VFRIFIEALCSSAEDPVHWIIFANFVQSEFNSDTARTWIFGEAIAREGKRSHYIQNQRKSDYGAKEFPQSHPHWLNVDNASSRYALQNFANQTDQINDDIHDELSSQEQGKDANIQWIKRVIREIKYLIRDKVEKSR